jgi:hypothetical protein
VASFITQLGTLAETANATSHPITLGSTTSVGDLVVVGFICGSASATMTVSDTKSNTWTSGTAIATPSAQGKTQTFWSVITSANASGDTITMSTGATSTRCAGIAISFSGSSGTSATVRDVEVQSGSSTATATPSIGTTAATAGASIVVCNLGFATVAGTVAAGSGYTISTTDHANTNSGFEMALEYKITAASAAESAGWTLPGTAAYHGDIQTFKVSGGGAAVTVKQLAALGVG